jgi:glycine cleavage system regulatory protein
VVGAHGGNWERSQMAELAGKFAGIVVVSIPQERTQAFSDAVRDLEGLLEVDVHEGTGGARPAGEELRIDLLGNDRPGIVREISGVLADHGLSIETIETLTREAPMAGGQLFEAHVLARIPADADPSAVRADLERLAGELLVDLDVG